jgi:hypothetical protein
VLGDSFLHVRKIDTEALGFDDEFLDLLAEEIGFFGFGGGGTLGDNGDGAGANFEEARVNEAGDDFVGGVGVDFELAAECADRGKFVTGAELTGDDGFRGGVDDLLVEGDAGLEIHVERDHACTITDRTADAMGFGDGGEMEEAEVRESRVCLAEVKLRSK